MKTRNKFNHRQKKTILVFGEGLHEQIFLKYLKDLYENNQKVSVKVEKGRGGSAYTIVEDACKEIGAFDLRAVVLDNDKSKKEMQNAETLANERNVLLLKNTPCLEGMLLAILTGKSFKTISSANCKKVFEKNHLSKNKRLDVNEYSKVFPKTLLDSQRRKIDELNRLIKVFL